MAYFLSRSIVSWLSKNQKVMTSTLAKAEYIAVAATMCQAVWLGRLHSDQVVLKVDNKFTTSLRESLVRHDRSMHIDTIYHYIRECLEEVKM